MGIDASYLWGLVNFRTLCMQVAKSQKKLRICMAQVGLFLISLIPVSLLNRRLIHADNVQTVHMRKRYWHNKGRFIVLIQIFVTIFK